MKKKLILTSMDACTKFQEFGIECTPEQVIPQKLERLGDQGKEVHRVIFRLACWAVKYRGRQRFIRVDGGSLVDKPLGASGVVVQLNDGFFYDNGTTISFFKSPIDGRIAFCENFVSNCKYQQIKDRDDFLE